jgi:hypothetical protein
MIRSITFSESTFPAQGNTILASIGAFGVRLSTARAFLAILDSLVNRFGVMKLAEPNRFRRLTTKPALLFWKPAFPAQANSVFGFLRSCEHGRASAFWAFLSFLVLGVLDPHVVNPAKPFSKMRSLANLARRAWRRMNLCVLGSVLTELKIFNPVVMPDSVDVVNFLNPSQKSSNLFLHQKAMLNDISLWGARRMARSLNHHVPIAVLVSFWHDGIKLSFGLLSRLSNVGETIC